MESTWLLAGAFGVFAIGYHAVCWFKAKSCFRRYASFNGGEVSSSKGRLILALTKPKNAEFRYYSTKRFVVTTYYEPLPDPLANFQLILRDSNPAKLVTVNFSSLERLHGIGSPAFQKKYQVYCDARDRDERLVNDILEQVLMYPPSALDGTLALQLYNGKFRFMWKKLPTTNAQLDELMRLGRRVLEDLVNASPVAKSNTLVSPANSIDSR